MNADLRLELKTLIVEACDKDCDPTSIGDDELLFGPEAPLQLDSLDALQVSMAIKKKYGLRLLLLRGRPSHQIRRSLRMELASKCMAALSKDLKSRGLLPPLAGFEARYLI